MALKLTIQGLLIYAAISANVLAALALAARVRWLSRVLFAAGFAIACGSLAYRWAHVGHVPMQNLFEVFLTLGTLVWPMSVFCRRFLRVGAQGADMLIAAVILTPAGLVFGAEAQPLPPALQSPLFAPHVAVYVAAYAIMAKAAVQAFALLIRGDGPSGPGLTSRDNATYRLVCLGFPLMTAGLLLGACWGKLAWGHWWNWDPKEMWSLATWLAFVGYFHFRVTFSRRHPRASAAWVLAGTALILITLLWANLSRLFTGLHSYA